MTAIERTAYPRGLQILSAKDLAGVYTPTPGDAWSLIVPGIDRVAEVGFLVLLKTYQRLGRFVPPSVKSLPPSLSISPSLLSLNRRHFEIAVFSQILWDLKSHGMRNEITEVVPFL